MMYLYSRIICLAVICFISASFHCIAADFKRIDNLAYKTGNGISEYEQTRCKLDLYIPSTGSSIPTLIWFHGGGLKNGDKTKKITTGLAETLAGSGVAVVAVNYRLSPTVKYPGYIEDSEAAVLWVLANIEKYGGDKGRVFVGGHSAGGYLALMLALDARYLKNAKVAGYIPVSGHTIVHNTVRGERGLDPKQVIVDQAAPLYHANKPDVSVLIFAADNDLVSRREENTLLYSELKRSGNKHVRFVVIDDRGHNSIIAKATSASDPLIKNIIQFMN